MKGVFQRKMTKKEIDDLENGTMEDQLNFIFQDEVLVRPTQEIKLSINTGGLRGSKLEDPSILNQPTLTFNHSSTPHISSPLLKHGQRDSLGTMANSYKQKNKFQLRKAS